MSSAPSVKRQLALEKELQQVTRVNKTIDNLLATIQKTQTDISKTKNATDNTAVLLEDWIRILSQTEFTHKVLNNPQWDGSRGLETEETATEAVDNDEDQQLKLEAKLDQEQALLDELNELNYENEHLVNSIRAKEIREKEVEQKRRDVALRRQRDLGLNPRSGSNGYTRRTGVTNRKPFK